ncbi:hypothetical protein CPC08DRAFT_715745 [Agrocybe pediades]|nr:hypothetical protein CPC08DRAFT_715745 [Agrocybe pediades]
MNPTSIQIPYTIFSSTLHSGKYAPENIMSDKPQDQSSRWSGAFQGSTNQWIVLRMESLAILKTITFGKFSKPHPCNMKELKVFAGASEDHMIEVLHAGLKNDNTPETFAIKHTNRSGVVFPTQFVKIVPISAHGPNFHVSIWYVALSGITDPDYVEQVRLKYSEFKEKSIMSYVLKHLRQRRLLTPFQTVLQRAGITFEHPLITQLHETLVLNGNWAASEQLLDSISAQGLFNSTGHYSQPRAQWTRLLGTDPDNDIPSPRGGHAMCMDPDNELIYLFGGYDGEKSLDDFWVYSVKEDKWKVLSHSTTREQNAPGARSCHKMVFDRKTGSIYVLGRLNDSDGPRGSNPQPQPSNFATRLATLAGTTGPAPPLLPRTPGEESVRYLSSEFYRYHTGGMLAGKWDFLSIDTGASGGPPLIFDHQMAMDSDAQTLYVFGGRVVDGNWDTSKYAGLYSYNVSTSKWKLLQPGDNTAGTPIIPTRFGHSMVFDPPSKLLYIFSGTREDRYLSDMYTYNTETNIAMQVFSDFTHAGGPEGCFTQRAVIDPALKEIYVYCGLTRHPNPPPPAPAPSTGSAQPSVTSSAAPTTNLRAHLSNWVYKYDRQPGKWMQVLHPSDKSPEEMPLPRFAHQVVYNPKTRTAYLHGGNAGGSVSILSSASTGGGTAGAAGSAAGSSDIAGNDSERSRPEGDAGGEERKEVPTPVRRLNDFWQMEIIRPSPEEIIRQAKFQIRKQQFREMCEEEEPVVALTFLQNQVSNVVDHSNMEETESFRSLLTHLLSPRPRPPPAPSASTSASKRRSTGDSDDSGSGEWTNEIGLPSFPMVSASPPSSPGGGGVQRLRDTKDPFEDLVRGWDVYDERRSPLSGPRYAQRTEVFENILKFVCRGQKQPDMGLLDLMDVDEEF